MLVGWALELLPACIFFAPLCITLWKVYKTKELTKENALYQPSQEWLDRQEEVRLQLLAGKCFGF